MVGGDKKKEKKRERNREKGEEEQEGVLASLGLSRGTTPKNHSVLQF